MEARYNVASQEFRQTMDLRADEVQAAIRTEQEERLDKVREAFIGLRSRVSTLEQIAGPKERLTPEQLGQLKETVNTLGVLKMEVEGSTRPFPGIYADVFMLAGVSAQRQLEMPTRRNTETARLLGNKESS